MTSNTFFTPQIRFKTSSDGNVTFIICVHDTTLGPAIGGLRWINYTSLENALMDVFRLGQGMTYKNAVALGNHGGGKAIAWGKLEDKTEEILVEFAEFVDSFGGQYWTAEDMNTTVQDMVYVSEKTKFVCGLPKEKGGSGDPSPATARGVLRALTATLEETGLIKPGQEDWSHLCMSLEGLGKTGYPLAQELHKRGARLIVSDISQDRLDMAAKEFGAQILLVDRDSRPGQIPTYDMDCDIFLPMARGGILNDETIPRLKCKVVCGAANNQLREERHGAELQMRGITYIPDFVANAGGVINVASEVDGQYSQELAFANVDKIYDRTKEILQIARKENITTNQAADMLAEKIITAKR